MIDELDSDLEGKKLWLKLWRDLVWSTLRAVPATREPYDARAEKRTSCDGTEAWEALAQHPQRSVDLPSTYYIGAQAKSAENIAFQDIERFRFLLHFWPFAASIYIPATLDREGKRDFNGFALVLPDICDSDAFVEGWPIVARGRGNEASGYRPRDAIIDIAGEGGLDVFRRSLEVLASKQGSTTALWLTAVDVFHLERDGNNVRVRDTSRIRSGTENGRRVRPDSRSLLEPSFSTSAHRLSSRTEAVVVGLCPAVLSDVRGHDHRTRQFSARLQSGHDGG